MLSSSWEKVTLPVAADIILLDLAFVPDEPDRGFLLGTRQTLLETNDGGKTWEARSVAAAQEPAKPVMALDGDAAMVTILIKGDKTAEFESVIAKYKEALAKSDNPKRKEQLAGLENARKTK